MEYQTEFFYTFIFVLITIIFYQIDVIYMKEKKLKKTEEKSKEMISTIDENVMQIKNLTNENEDLR